MPEGLVQPVTPPPLEANSFLKSEMISIAANTTAEAYRQFGVQSKKLTHNTLKDIHADLGDTLPQRRKEILESWSNFKKLSEQGIFTVEGKNYGAQHALMVEQFAKGAGIPLSDALLIQAEAEAGCQTMFIKDKNGIYAIHTEEDVDDHAVTALNRRRDPSKPIPAGEKEWNKFSENTPYNYRNVHIKTQDGHERTFFAYAGIATGGPAFGVNQETGTLVASDILFTESDVSVARGIWPNAICALYQDVGDIAKARILTRQINKAIQDGSLDGITGGYALHMAQAGKEPTMATFEFGNKTITEMPPKEVVHINAKTGEQEIRYVTSRPNLPKNPELTDVDALNSEALLVKLNRRFPAVEKRLRTLLERTSLTSYNSAHRELAAKLLTNKTIPLFDTDALQTINSGFPNLVEEAKHASKAFWGHLKMATWQVEMDRRQRRLDKYGAFVEFPGKAEGKDAMLTALRRIATTRHGDIDPTTNTWRQDPEKDNAGLMNPWNVAVMTAYVDRNGVHGEIHKLTPAQTTESARKDYILSGKTITDEQKLVGRGDVLDARKTLQDYAANRITTDSFSAKDRESQRNMKTINQIVNTLKLAFTTDNKLKGNRLNTPVLSDRTLSESFIADFLSSSLPVGDRDPNNEDTMAFFATEHLTRRTNPRDQSYGFPRIYGKYDKKGKPFFSIETNYGADHFKHSILKDKPGFITIDCNGKIFRQANGKTYPLTEGETHELRSIFHDLTQSIQNEVARAGITAKHQ